MKKQGKLPSIEVAFANIILAGAGGACILTLLYCAYFYGLTAQRQFTSFAGALVYCGVPALVAALSFLSLRLNLGYRLIVAIAFVLLSASVYGFESLLNLLHPSTDVLHTGLMDRPTQERKNVADQLARKFGVDIDTRDQFEVLTDLRKQGIEAVPQIVLPLLEKQGDNSMKSAVRIDGVEFMPLSGMANKLTVACNHTGKALTYETDEHGFHNPKGLWRPGSIDIAAVGNSNTLGYCVPSGDNFVALIRRLYPATVNLGITGAGPLAILGHLREYARILKPKLTLWFYSEPTFSELRSEKQSRVLMSYLTNNFTQSLLERQSDIDRALEPYVAVQATGSKGGPAANTRKDTTRRLLAGFVDFIKLSGVRQRLGLIYGAGLSDSELSEPQWDLSLLRDILSLAKARIGAWGGKLIIVYLPEPRPTPWQDPGTDIGAHSQVLQIASSLGIPTIDVHLALDAAHRDPLNLVLVDRYTQEAHRLIAEQVLDTISQMAWLNPNNETH
jgi:hypothetical protein